MADMTRAEYLAWAKKRALEYLPHNPRGAVTSIISDLDQNPETKLAPGLAGMLLLVMGDKHDIEEVRRFVEGFN